MGLTSSITRYTRSAETTAPTPALTVRAAITAKSPVWKAGPACVPCNSRCGSPSRVRRHERACRGSPSGFPLLFVCRAENSGTDATDSRNQSGADDEGTCGLLTGMELLWLLISRYRPQAESRAQRVYALIS